MNVGVNNAACGIGESVNLFCYDVNGASNEEVSSCFFLFLFFKTESVTPLKILHNLNIIESRLCLHFCMH